MAGSPASPPTIPIIGLPSVDSTNDEARRRLAAGPLAGPVAIMAREQTAGRGTRGRHWDSPDGAGLYLSLALPGRAWPLGESAAESSEPFPSPATSAAAAAAAAAASAPLQLTHTLAAGVAAAEAIADVFGLAVRLKPVNDLVVDGAKLGGILAETIVRNGRIDAMVVGVGINLQRGERRIAAGALPSTSIEELRPPGAAMTEADAARLAERLVERLAAWIRRVVVEGDATATEAWRRLAVPGTMLPPADGGRRTAD